MACIWAALLAFILSVGVWLSLWGLSLFLCISVLNGLKMRFRVLGVFWVGLFPLRGSVLFFVLVGWFSFLGGLFLCCWGLVFPCGFLSVYRLFFTCLFCVNILLLLQCLFIVFMVANDFILFDYQLINNYFILWF